MKKLIYSILFVLPMLASCVVDNGNYDYSEIDEITFENIPQVTEVLSKIDNIKISPKFISKKNGEIKSGDPNYTVKYRIGHKGMGSFGYDREAGHSIVWKDVTPKEGFNLDILADLSEGAYTLWITLTDNNTGAVTSKQYDISVRSTIYEGWLVLCNEGADEKVRLDMISKLNSTRIETIHNVTEGLPDIHHATGLIMFAQEQDPGDQMYIFSEENSYGLDVETFKTSVDEEFVANQFFSDPEDKIIKMDLFTASTYTWLLKYKVAFGKSGNVYVFVDGSGGAMFSTACNTLKEGTSPSFRVAPYMGYSWVRPWASSYAANILFYDIDNKRFVYFAGGTNFKGDDRLQLNVLPDPSGDDPYYYSFTTGKDFVYMQSTSFGGGLVYTILQDPATGKRTIYPVNMATSTPSQQKPIEVTATDFEKATQFAFDNISAALYYAVDNKLYCYYLGSQQVEEIPTGLSADEKITVLKFNKWRMADYTKFEDSSEEFLNQQNRLIVGSSNPSVENSGKVTFYDIVRGSNNTVTRGEQYSGFANIVDITYRERRQ